MSDNTAIEWTDATWNPIRAKNRETGKLGWYCEHVTEACRFCYAERRNMNTFFGNGLAYKPGNLDKVVISLDENLLQWPLRWRRGRKIFPLSMTDLFADFVTDDMIDKILAVCALTPRHTYQILTKRPARLRAYMAERWQGTPAQQIDLRQDFGIVGAKPMTMPAGRETGRYHQIQMVAEDILDLVPRLRDTENDAQWDEKGALKIMQFGWPLPNVWFGVSIAEQEDADKFIPDLLATPAAKRFASCEPLLGPVDLTAIPRAHAEGFMRPLDGRFNRLDWVICGGESGPLARPMHPRWAQNLRDQCADAQVPFFFKQWGEWAPSSTGGSLISYRGNLLANGKVGDTLPDIPSDAWMARVGKRTAGRRLDGIEHDAFPEAA